MIFALTLTVNCGTVLVGKRMETNLCVEIGYFMCSFNFFGGGLETGNIVANKIHMAPVIIEPRD